MSTPILFLDEFAFLKHNQIIYNAAYPAWSQASLEAKLANKPHGITIITTPNNLNLDNAAFTMNTIIKKAAKFTVKLYDMSPKELRAYISANSENDYLFIEYDWKEIGRTQEWYDQQVRGLNGDLMIIKREIDLVWPKSDEGSVFSERTLEILEESVIEDLPELELLIDGKYQVKFNTEYSRSRSYALTVDPATGSKRDSSAITIVDPFTDIPIGYFSSNTITIPELEVVITKLMTDVFPNSFTIIERNSIGIGIIQHLLLNKDIKKRIFYEIRDERDNVQKTISSIPLIHPTNKSNRVKRSYGIFNDRGIREKLILTLFDIVQNNPELITIEQIYSEISTLTRTKSGKVEHSPGKHDDLLISYLLYQYVKRYANGTLGRFITNVGSLDDEADELLFAKRKAAKKRTTKLITKSNAGENPYISAQNQSMIEYGMDLNERASIEENKGSRYSGMRKILSYNRKR